MIRTSRITNLGNSISKFQEEMSIKNFISKYETFEGRSIKKDEINLLSVFFIDNGESTYYNVRWSLN